MVHPLRPDALGKIEGYDFVYLIRNLETVLGKAAETDVQLPAIEGVSGQHLKIVLTESGFKLKVVGQNGVLVDGTLVSRSEVLHPLSDRSELVFPGTGERVYFTSFISDGPKDASARLSSSRRAVKQEPESSDFRQEFPSPPATLLAAEPSPPIYPSTSNEKLSEQTFVGKKGTVVGRKCTAPVSVVMDENRATLTASPTEGMEDLAKPPFSYTQLIVQAISEAPQQKLHLRDIYAALKEKYPFFQTCTSWQNSIRHNLSLHKFFRMDKESQNVGSHRSHYWLLDPQVKDRLIHDAYLPKRMKDRHDSPKSLEPLSPVPSKVPKAILSSPAHTLPTLHAPHGSSPTPTQASSTSRMLPKPDLNWVPLKTKLAGSGFAIIPSAVSSSSSTTPTSAGGLSSTLSGNALGGNVFRFPGPPLDSRLNFPGITAPPPWIVKPALPRLASEKGVAPSQGSSNSAGVLVTGQTPAETPKGTLSCPGDMARVTAPLKQESVARTNTISPGSNRCPSNKQQMVTSTCLSECSGNSSVA